MLCKLVTRIKNKQLVKMSKCLEKTHQDFVVRSSDFGLSEWKNLLRSVHFECLFYTYEQKRGKIGD